MISGCQKRFPNVLLNKDDILKGIKIAAPRNLNELFSIVHGLKKYLSAVSKVSRDLGNKMNFNKKYCESKLICNILVHFFKSYFLINETIDF